MENEEENNLFQKMKKVQELIKSESIKFNYSK